MLDYDFIRVQNHFVVLDYGVGCWKTNPTYLTNVRHMLQKVFPNLMKESGTVGEKPYPFLFADYPLVLPGGSDEKNTSLVGDSLES